MRSRGRCSNGFDGVLNMQEAPRRPNGDDSSDSTQAFDTSGFVGEAADDQKPLSEPLFEQYQPRSLRSIVEQQRARRDSEAAEAARVILEDFEPPAFDFPQQDQVQTLLGDPDDRFRRYTSIRVQRVSPMGTLVTPGAQFVYALLIITLLSGLIGLAASTNSAQLVLIAGIATPMLLPVCIWKWIRWLDSDPYYYRLLTSLGEDARNLMSYRLLWKRSGPG